MRHCTNLHLMLFMLIGLVLVGCSNQPTAPLVMVASPDAPDAGFYTYQHSTGVFSIRIPPDWIPDQLPDPNGIRTQFTSIEGNHRAVRLTVHVVNTGQPMTQEAFLQAVQNYQPPDDLAGIPWTPLHDSDIMHDGSVRLTGIRHYPMQGDRAMNIFLQSNGSYFTALEVDVTDLPPDVLEKLMAVVNTYRINPNAALVVGDVVAGGMVSETGVIHFQNYHHWVDTTGGFNITGEVVNQSEEPLEAVRLIASLYDQAGTSLAERADVLPYDVLQPGVLVPFRIRFSTGQPSTAVRYELQAAARTAEFSLPRFYGNENFVTSHEAAYNPDGYLTASGIVQNNGARLAGSIQIIATVYNESGQVVATESTFLSKDQLLPAEATDFEITFYEVGGGVYSTSIIVQGEILQ